MVPEVHEHIFEFVQEEVWSDEHKAWFVRDKYPEYLISTTTRTRKKFRCQLMGKVRYDPASDSDVYINRQCNWTTYLPKENMSEDPNGPNRLYS